MINREYIFNRNVINNKLNNIKIGDIPRFKEKINKIDKWKYSIDNSDLNKTKEKQLQGKFLLDFFCDILEYKNQIGRRDWSFIQEQKTDADGTTPDGVLGYFSNEYKDVRVVIELKDAMTNLDAKQKGRTNKISSVEQAFSYAPKFGSRCKWIIVSNFKEIRLYSASNALEYEKFEITDLIDEENFKKFYFLLNKENLINPSRDSVIDKLYLSNIEESKNITKNFYEEYKKTRLRLFKGMKDNNPSIEDLSLFEKAQKLMDRFIFICFCEDKQLLPENTFKTVITNARNSFSTSNQKIWTELKGLFASIDKGNPPMQINRFNGGLFAPDLILDSLYIPDNLFNGLEAISQYNFDTDLNVNILGHIFEQSIGDIEEIKSEINGEQIDKNKSKRKKDGIFYTPEYVTNYIIDKCIGTWLEEKRVELGERELPVIPEFKPRMSSTEKRNRTSALNKHINFWKSYAKILANIKILDPACGSGAFLNAAFDYLLKEGMRVNEELAKVDNGQFFMFDLDKNILKNNLFGVDLNAESVEITKLSLWLMTANKREPLTSLDENIICGNSLIDDINIAGDKAMDWKLKFKSIMDDGGFDIIIANPPYGAKLSDKEKAYLDKAYKTTQYNYDTYKFFIELAFNLCKKNGYVGLITPNTYFILEKSNILREFIFNNYELKQLVELYDVFPDAVVEPIISIYKKVMPSINNKFEVICVPRKTKIEEGNFIQYGTKIYFIQEDLRSKDGYVFNYKETKLEKKLSTKLDKISKPLSEYLNVTTGIKPYQTGKGTPKQTKELVKNKPFDGNVKIDDTWIKYMKGENIDRYTDKWSGEYIKYGEWLAEPRKPEMFFNEKIFIRQTSNRLIATYDNEGKVCKNTLHCIYKKNEHSSINLKVILGIINSKLLNWKFQHDNFHIVGKPLAETKVIYVNRLPIKYPENVDLFSDQVEKLLAKNQEKYMSIKKFVNFIEKSYQPKKITNRIWDFCNLEYIDFYNELKKQKVKINEKMKFELLDLFEEQKKQIDKIDNEIEKLNSNLDKAVYNLYELTEEEIKIVEDNIK